MFTKKQSKKYIKDLEPEEKKIAMQYLNYWNTLQVSLDEANKYKKIKALEPEKKKIAMEYLNYWNKPSVSLAYAIYN